jgi:hypothetical protein
MKPRLSRCLRAGVFEPSEKSIGFFVWTNVTRPRRVLFRLLGPASSPFAQPSSVVLDFLPERGQLDSSTIVGSYAVARVT